MASCDVIDDIGIVNIDADSRATSNCLRFVEADGVNNTLVKTDITGAFSTRSDDFPENKTLV